MYGMVSNTRAERAAWVDLAKGLLMILVVLHHSYLFLSQEGLTPRYWDAIDAFLATVRMPAFFLLAGVFAQSALRVGVGEFVRRKVCPYLYMWALWAIPYVLVFAAVQHAQGWGNAIAKQVLDLLTLNNILWYLFALAAYFVALRLMRSVPVVIQVALAAVVSVAFVSATISTGSWGMDHMAEYFVYFLVGCHFSVRVHHLAGRASVWPVVHLCAAWMAVVVVTFWLIPDLRYVATAVLPLITLPLAVMVSKMLGRSAAFRPAVAVGTNTLPLYVQHGPIALVLVSLVTGLPQAVTASTAAVLPPIVAACTVAVSVAVSRALGRVPGLYRAPWLAGTPARAAV